MKAEERKAWEDDIRAKIADYDSRIEMWQDIRDRLHSELHPPTQGPKTRLETATHDYFKRKTMENLTT